LPNIEFSGEIFFFFSFCHCHKKKQKSLAASIGSPLATGLGDAALPTLLDDSVVENIYFELQTMKN